jgi:protocatechuate 3,4-dioxygenase beta subunit
VELNRSVQSDDEGHYVFRSLKPGTYTVAAIVDGRAVQREVEVPGGPVSIQGVDLEAK